MLLFLHGFPENSYSWRHQLAHFRDSFTVICLDMRGFGDSDAPCGMSNYTMDEICLDVCAVVKACGYTSCVLVGHDWGGMVAWNVASNFPGLVSALVTICSPHPRAYHEKKCFTLEQVSRSSYFLLFAASFLPEMWLRHRQGCELRNMFLSSPMGALSPTALTEAEIQFYVNSLLRPYRLSAGLHYYRNAMRGGSERSRQFISR